jgi:hypothetical protein
LKYARETLTEWRFRDAWRAVGKGHAKETQGADALRDQELARLFHECKWTQEAIARKMGKSQRWVSYHLTFWAYLQFRTNGSNLKYALETLTEWRFRDASRM